MKVTIIVPTYNEKDNITKLIKAIFSVVKQIKSHQVNLLIVDDNSPDGTQEIVKSLQKHNKDLYMITGKKEGLGKAYLRGMEYASEKLKADVMFEMDADFQHDPKLLPQFMEKIDQGYDLVIGSRYIQGGSIPSNWGLDRKIYSVFGNLIVRTMLLNFKHHDWTTGYRAIRTPIYKKVKSELGNYKGYTFQVSFLHKAFTKGAKVTEVPIQFIDRVHGESKIGSVEYIYNLFKYLLEVNLKNPPRALRFFIVGTSGFTINTVIFELLRTTITPPLAGALGAEVAIISNFIFNNFWTFSDRKLDANKIPQKFIVFNLASFGSVIIQAISIWIFITMLGSDAMIQRTGYIVGVLIGLFWNYTMYNKVVWKKSATN